MCEKVCPALAIEMYPVMANERKSKRLVIYLSRCTYCSECAEVCPKEAIVMSQEFMTAAFDKYGDSLVMGIAERRIHEIHEESVSADDDKKDGE
jgi:formate hydrogenlyase subunit 6/NADH:ubiquinone oxidoreductase subunit I